MGAKNNTQPEMARVSPPPPAKQTAPTSRWLQLSRRNHTFRAGTSVLMPRMSTVPSRPKRTSHSRRTTSNLAPGRNGGSELAVPNPGSHHEPRSEPLPPVRNGARPPFASTSNRSALPACLSCPTAQRAARDISSPGKTKPSCDMRHSCRFEICQRSGLD